VRVIAGNDKGKEGRILRVVSEKAATSSWKGVNLRIRHVRPSPQYPQGGRIQQEMPIHVSNVMPLDSNGRPTRVGRKWVEDPATGRGRWVRYAKTTGEELDR